MASLCAHLTKIMEKAFSDLGLLVENARVTVSGQSQEGVQFQCNGAMPSAKAVRKNPREIAASVIAILEKDKDVFKELSVGGPGFINIILNDKLIGEYSLASTAKAEHSVANIGQGKTVVLDYGGPNIAKAMHVGHLRSSIIGDSLRRIYAYAGYKTIGDVHMGDWGTPMGMILSELDIMGYNGEVTMEMLAEIYPKASSDCKSDEKRMEMAREATKKLQAGDEEYRRRWREFIDVSIAGMKANFDALGVYFDEWKGESDAHQYIDNMVEDLKTRGIAVEDEGAWIVPVSHESDKKEIPPLILLKSDGAVLYSTTDMATIIDRMKTHNPQKIVYIVDQRQHLHFEQVFRASRKSGIVPEQGVELDFAGFGTMNGKDGKPFKTRAGGVMRLEDLIAMAKEKAILRLEEADLAKEMDDQERGDIAHKVAISALKFADLQNNRISDYVFDLDRMTSFEGKTGPYLLYQAVRIQSLLRKAGVEEEIKLNAYIIKDEDRELALLLSGFEDHFIGALKNYTPHILCEYVYRLAQEFSSFYGSCHIVTECDNDLKMSRLALCQQTHKVLILILELLGICVPERM